MKTLTIREAIALYPSLLDEPVALVETRDSAVFEFFGSANSRSKWHLRLDPKQPVVKDDIEITFSASGYVKHRIVVTNPAYNDPQKLVDGLNAGTLVTTIQEGGDVEVTATSERIGYVSSVDNELEYEDFELPFDLAAHMKRAGAAEVSEEEGD